MLTYSQFARVLPPSFHPHPCSLSFPRALSLSPLSLARFAGGYEPPPEAACTKAQILTQAVGTNAQILPQAVGTNAQILTQGSLRASRCTAAGYEPPRSADSARGDADEGRVEHQVRSLLALLVQNYLLYCYKSTTVVTQMMAEASIRC
jgi:hypothetical protein